MPTKLTKHMVIPDVQARPGVPLDHLSWIGQYLVDKKPETVVCLGDFSDLPSLSSYDKGKKSFEGRRYKADVDATIEAMTLLMAPLREYNRKRNQSRRYKPRLVMTLGNHEDRIRRAVEDDAMLEGTMSVDDLQYEAFGWEVHPFLEVVEIDGVHYSHYFTSGVMGRPVSSARALVKAKHCSATMGHVQTTDVYMGDSKPDGTPIVGLFAGVAYQHNEIYLGPQGNSCRRQIVMCHEVHNGGYDLMLVSLDYLKRRYAKKQAA